MYLASILHPGRPVVFPDRYGPGNAPHLRLQERSPVSGIEGETRIPGTISPILPRLERDGSPPLRKADLRLACRERQWLAVRKRVTVDGNALASLPNHVTRSRDDGLEVGCAAIGAGVRGMVFIHQPAIVEARRQARAECYHITNPQACPRRYRRHRPYPHRLAGR